MLVREVLERALQCAAVLSCGGCLCFRGVSDLPEGSRPHLQSGVYDVSGENVGLDKIPDDRIQDFATFAMMASNAYHREGRTAFPVSRLGWRLLADDGSVQSGDPAEGKSTSWRWTGLAYDVYRHEESGRVVFAFRGTDARGDYLSGNLPFWPFDGQYVQARCAVMAFLLDHAELDRNDCWVVGHSLGGGLALCASVRCGVPAVTFDSSPRIFDGLGDEHCDAPRSLVYMEGEVLASLRRTIPKALQVTAPDQRFCAIDATRPGVSRHRGDAIAQAMVREAARRFPGSEFEAIYQSALADDSKWLLK